MEKKGQVAVFIILGIVILALAVGVFLLKENIFKAGLEPEAGIPNTGFIKSSFEDCLKSSAEDALVLVGKQGGYYVSPSGSEPFFDSYIPYYFYEKEEMLPNIKMLEEELALAVKDLMPSCLDKIAAFQDTQGISVRYSIEQTSVLISDNKIFLEANIPTRISKGGISKGDEEETTAEEITAKETTATLDKFSAEITSHYKKMYDYSQEIVQMQAAFPNYFPLGYLSDIAEEEGFDFELIAPESVESEREESEAEVILLPDNDHNKIIVSIIDNSFFDKPYYFTFGMFYDVDYDLEFKEDVSLEEEAVKETEQALSEG